LAQAWACDSVSRFAALGRIAFSLSDHFAHIAGYGDDFAIFDQLRRDADTDYAGDVKLAGQNGGGS
jgi:hypothetical protein